MASVSNVEYPRYVIRREFDDATSVHFYRLIILHSFLTSLQSLPFLHLYQTFAFLFRVAKASQSIYCRIKHKDHVIRP